MVESSRTDATDATFTKPSLRVIERVVGAEDVEPRSAASISTVCSLSAA